MMCVETSVYLKARASSQLPWILGCELSWMDLEMF